MKRDVCLGSGSAGYSIFLVSCFSFKECMHPSVRPFDTVRTTCPTPPVMSIIPSGGDDVVSITTVAAVPHACHPYIRFPGETQCVVPGRSSRVVIVVNQSINGDAPCQPSTRLIHHTYYCAYTYSSR
mmetsp:Transcript_10356/g.10005  ORF Transcript_10356/g.10005 Transcript_10356/m.10005 type:complete len:127 (+) Transcript_10356:55-435(+)